MKVFIEHIKLSLSENKHLYIVSSFTFLLMYLSAFIKGYGYFIDEFYYIACANNPAFGYVDHPPLAQYKVCKRWLVVKLVLSLYAESRLPKDNIYFLNTIP